jgi:thiosulfate/3-mercaptopyruvate sulfurtransferase
MTSAPVQVDDVVITAETLRKEIEAGRDVVILDVHRDAAGHQGQARLPGAHAVTLTTDLVGAPSGGTGNLPLPTAEHVQEVVRRWGINTDSVVVAYSQEHPALAARAWWTLKWAGVPDVRVLDGGTVQWLAVGGEVTLTEAQTGAEGTFVVRTGALPTLSADDAAALARSGALLDARVAAGYAGTSGGGHIPGAQSLPVDALLGDDGRLADDEKLRQVYDAVGADGQTPIGAYCGGGTSATLTVLALAKIGIGAALYPGSFSEWSSDPTRPVAAGDQPG